MQRYSLLHQRIAIFAFVLLLVCGAALAQETAPDGSLIHTVAPGETFDAIAINYDLTRNELLALNPDVTNPGLIQIGQRLVVRAGETTPTPTPVPPTPGPSPVELAAPAPIRSAETGDVLPPVDPVVGAANICVSLFDDRNENRIRESDEALLAGGQIRLSGETTATFTPDGETDPHCFEGLSAGVYTVVADAPENYGLTTPRQLHVEAVPGVSVQIAFGAVRGAVPPVRVVNASNNNNNIVNDVVVTEAPSRPANPLLDNLGLIAIGLAGVVLVGGLGVSLLLRRR
jgi:hypothetical protein